MKWRENKKNQVFLDEIVGFGRFFGHDGSKGNRAHGADEVFRKFEEIILHQAKASVIYGEPTGFAKLCALAYNEKANEAIEIVKEKTDPKAYDFLGTMNFCGGKFNDLYKGTGVFEELDVYKTKKRIHERCLHPIKYIDACLFGAKMAECNRDNKNAKLLYDRTKKAIDEAGWHFPDEPRHKYDRYGGLLIKRYQNWKKAMKRMYKAGAFDKGKIAKSLGKDVYALI